LIPKKVTVAVTHPNIVSRIITYFTEYTLAAGGKRVPVINSPADIYRYFPRRLNYEGSPQEDLHSQKRLNSSEETSSSDTSGSDDSISESARNKEKNSAFETLTAGTMQAEVLQKLQ